jgi:MFS family permease
LVNQSFGSAGFIAAATLGSIVGAELGGSDRLAGVPATAYLLGGAGASLMGGFLMELIGRRASLLVGLLVAIGGGAIAFLAVNAASLPIFLGGLVFIGVGFAIVQLGRFIAAEVSIPTQRGRAISTVVFGGTIGAVFGPLLVGPAGRLALELGYLELSGPYAIAGLLFSLALPVVFFGLRPDPRKLSFEIEQRYPTSGTESGKMRPLGEILRQPGAAVAVATMVLGQMVMVMVMVLTALHMRENAHPLSSVSVVISGHTLGMYATSPLSGYLIDRRGRKPVILLGGALLFLACITAPLTPRLIPLVASLLLLGVGWNLCYVAGSTLLSDHLTPVERPRIQGTNDLLVGLASAASSLGSGIVFASAGYTVMALSGAFLSLIILLLAAAKLRTLPTEALQQAAPG